MNSATPPFRSPLSTARSLPALAAAAVVGAVFVAGAAGGLGGNDGIAKPTVANSSTTVPPSSFGVPPSTQAVVTASTDAPLVTTTLDQPLGYGSAGDAVRQVQERLTELGFFVGPIDGQFGALTQKAVWAFEKLVMQTPRDEATGVITDQMWQLMQQPMRIDPRRKHSEGEATQNHTEVYLPEQVVAFFINDEVVLISHMSSGTGEEWKEEVTIDVGEYGNNTDQPIVRGEIGVSITPGGVYDYDRMIEGVRESALGSLWNPAYFNYGIAIHGAMNVPLEPASHGCIRVPLKVGEIFHQYVSVGDQVFVWDGVKEPEMYGDQPPIFNRIDPDYSTTTTSTTTSATTTTVPATTPVTTQPSQTFPATSPSTTAPAITITTSTTTAATTTTTTTTAAASWATG